MGRGFGDDPQACVETIRMAVAAGLVGGFIDDATGRPGDPIYPFALAIERVSAAVAAARAWPFPFVLTARAENLITGRPDLTDTIRRLEGFAAAGADVLYASGLTTRDAIKSVVRAVAPKPVIVVMELTGATFSRAELGDLGVERVSLGSSLARAAFGALLRASREVRDSGKFTFSRDAMPCSGLNALSDRMGPPLLPGARSPAFRKRREPEERSITAGMQTEADECEVHFGAACRLDDKARQARQSRGTSAVVMEKAADDLPIVHPSTFELAINLKSARTPAFIVPPSLHLRAGGQPDSAVFRQAIARRCSAMSPSARFSSARPAARGGGGHRAFRQGGPACAPMALVWAPTSRSDTQTVHFNAGWIATTHAKLFRSPGRESQIPIAPPRQPSASQTPFAPLNR